MTRRGGRRLAVAIGMLGLCPALALAQGQAPRFSAFSDSTLGAPTTFSAAPPRQAAPSSTTAPAPRISAQRAQPPRPPGVIPQARQEELLANAYAAAPEGDRAAENPFASWHPRLLPTAVDPTPDLPPARADTPPRPPAEIKPTIRFWSGRQTRTVPGELAAMIASKAHKHGVPVELAHAIVTVESNYNPRAHGGGATLGLMQIKHPTARGMGFTGTAQDLYDPATNLEWGMRYLAGARKIAKGNLCGTILRYQAGHRATEMTAHAMGYCAKVRALMGEQADTIVAERAPERPRARAVARVAEGSAGKPLRIQQPRRP
jgi:soluble lytic murein transglycosylase-like protein